MSELQELLAQAQEADPTDRINLRDPIAAHGDSAIEAMTDWIGDPRLAAFAIRVLEVIGRQPPLRAAVIDVLLAVDRSEMAPALVGDLDQKLAALGHSAQKNRRTSRPAGMPGLAGRGYWVMRTSPWERPFIWAEAQVGRLRQGWGVEPEQNLEVIAATLKRGEALTGLQLEARRALRMLASWDHGMQFGDVVIAPNLPEHWRLSIFRVVGSYEWSPVAPRRWGDRFGHVLPVEMLMSDIDRGSPSISDGLRAVLGVQTRLYNITGYGGDVERLMGGKVSEDRWGELWTEVEYETLFGRFPPTGERPSERDVDAVSAELGRTPDAIDWQWGDGASYVQGGTASTTSDPLKAWLERRGFRR